jgi:hypothetical protein
MRRDQVTREASLAEMERLAEAPEFVLCRFHQLVHDRSSSAGACSCCGSDTAKVVEDLPDFELLIDTVEGERYLRGPMFPGPRA